MDRNHFFAAQNGGQGTIEIGRQVHQIEPPFGVGKAAVVGRDQENAFQFFLMPYLQF